MNKIQKYKIQAFNEVRIITYIAVILNVIIVYKFKPFRCLCDDGIIQCSMCGMREAFDKLLQFDLHSAYLANRYIGLALFCFVVMILDALFIFIFNIKHFKK